MPEYLSPGVYVEEVDSGPQPIVGVSTTTTGVVGVTYQGPVGIPTLVIGYSDFKNKFGGYLDRRAYPGGTWYLPHAVEAFFTNGGQRLYIVRILPDTATPATLRLFDRGPGDGAATQLAMRAGANDTAIVVNSTTGINTNDWLRIDDQAFTEYVQAVVPATSGLRAIRTPLRFSHPAGATSPVVSVTITPTPATNLAADIAPGQTSIRVASRTGLAVGNVVQIGPPGAPTIVPAEFAIIAALPPDPAGQLVKLDAPLAFAHDGTGTPEAVQTVTEAVGTASQLDQNATAGQAVLVIQTTGGSGNFTAGSVLRVGGATDTNREYHIVASTQVHGADTVPVGYALLHPVGNAHPALDVVQSVTLAVATGTASFDQTLQTAAPAGATSLNLVSLSPGAGNNALAMNDLLQIGTGATQEYVTLAITPWDSTSTIISLVQALQFAHAAGEHAVRMATPAADPTKTTTLLQGLNAGDAELLVADTSAGLVQIGPAGSSWVEYRTLGPQTPIVPVGVKTGLGTGDGLLYDHGHGASVAGRSTELRVQAIDYGTWGNDVEISVFDSVPPYARATAAADPNPGSNQLTLSSTVGLEVGSVVNIAFSAGTSQRKVTNVTGKVITLSASHGSAVVAGTQVTSQEFNLRADLIQVNPLTGKTRIIQTETFHQLSMDPRHSHYAPKIIGPIFRTDSTTPREADGRTNGQGTLIRVEDALADPTTGVLSPANVLVAQNTIRVGPDVIVDAAGNPVTLPLNGGDDDIGNVVDDTYIGQDDPNPRNRTGLFALQNIDEISQVAIPGETSQVVQQAVIDHVELMRYRFGVLDSILGADLDNVSAQRGLYDSKYAALYYPWLMIEDPFPDNPRNPGLISVPPSGAVLGVIARTDIKRGVFKAPANELVEGIEDLEVKLMKEQQDVLNPQNINVVRDFREHLRGIRVWGARNVSSDPDWTYVNVRRLFNFIEHSIDIGTQSYVFEPNDSFLWQRVKRSVGAFLRSVWHDGGLSGAKPEDAYYVHVGNDTMTPDDMANGRLIVEVGIAPTYPAEFVIFRIGQWVGGSSVTEG